MLNPVMLSIWKLVDLLVLRLAVLFKLKVTMVFFGPKWSYENIAVIEFGRNNLLIITPTYEQITSPERLRFGPINPDNYQVFVVKSRVHFRGGFDETGYAKTILVVDAPGPWFGTTRLDALDYEFGPISRTVSI